MDADVIIVGAGLSGLTCAIELRRSELEPLVLEASAAVGGRLRTDAVDGFLLDRGFQVLLTSYPQARAYLDFNELGLGTFLPGAWLGQADGQGGGYWVADPLRQPLQLPKTLRAPIGSLTDKLLILKLRRLLRSSPPQRSADWTERSAADWLRSFGFSTTVISQFFKPFFRGVLLEENLHSEAWLLATLYHYFTVGLAALPRGGMQSIPAQLAHAVGAARIQLNTRVVETSPQAVVLDDGRRISAAYVVIACDQAGSAALGTAAGKADFNASGCHYFVAPENPLHRGRLLWLNASGKGAIAQVATPAAVQNTYAPSGRHLISVGTTGQRAVERSALMSELRDYFGSVVDSWQVLADYWIPRALPRRFAHGSHLPFQRFQQVEGKYVCGDYLSYGSIDAAMASGAETARAIAEHLNGDAAGGTTAAS